jgi:hypothetical protein
MRSLYNARGRTHPVIITSTIFGAIAQLGERFHGMDEVVGSSPTSSTKD